MAFVMCVAGRERPAVFCCAKPGEWRGSGCDLRVSACRVLAASPRSGSCSPACCLAHMQRTASSPARIWLSVLPPKPHSLHALDMSCSLPPEAPPDLGHAVRSKLGRQPSRLHHLPQSTPDIRAEVMRPCLGKLPPRTLPPSTPRESPREFPQEGGLDARSTACIRARAEALFALHGPRPSSAAAKKAAYTLFARTEEHSCHGLG